MNSSSRNKISEVTYIAIFLNDDPIGRFFLAEALAWLRIPEMNLKFLIITSSPGSISDLRDEIAEETGYKSNIRHRCRVLSKLNKHNLITFKKYLSSATIAINILQPYRVTCFDIIKMCVNTKTHYIDICRDGTLMEEVEVLYHEVAKKCGVAIVQGCGFDPALIDLCVSHLCSIAESEGGHMLDVESYLEIFDSCGRAVPYEAEAMATRYGAASGVKLSVHQHMQDLRPVSATINAKEQPLTHFVSEVIPSENVWYPATTVAADVVSRTYGIKARGTGRDGYGFHCNNFVGIGENCLSVSNFHLIRGSVNMFQGTTCSWNFLSNFSNKIVRQSKLHQYTFRLSVIANYFESAVNESATRVLESLPPHDRIPNKRLVHVVCGSEPFIISTCAILGMLTRLMISKCLQSSQDVGYGVLTPSILVSGIEEDARTMLKRVFNVGVNKFSMNNREIRSSEVFNINVPRPSKKRMMCC